MLPPAERHREMPGTGTRGTGRDHERHTLRGALERAIAGYGSLVLIGGEAGIGKTTLAEELLHYAESTGCVTLEGRCYQGGESLPYGPWGAACRSLQRVLGDDCAVPLCGLSPGQTPAGNQRELFVSIASALGDASKRHSVVLLLEDIHWADRASLDLLRYIGRQVADMRLLVLATYRHDTAPDESLLVSLLPDLVRESGAIRINPARLRETDIAELVTGRYRLEDPDRERLVQFLYLRADGHPFFTTELLRDLELSGALERVDDKHWALGELGSIPVPELVRQVIEARLNLTDATTKHLLDIAAVIGQDVPVDLWQAAAGADDEQLIATIEEASRLHLIIESPDGRMVRFSHGLIRQTIYDSRSLLRRRQQHRAIAEFLSEDSAADPDLVAGHFWRAGDERAISWLVQAGERALALYAARDAETSLSRAIDLAADLGHDAPVPALLLRARAREMLGEFDLAIADLHSVQHHAEQAGNPDTTWQALQHLGEISTGSDYPKAARYLEHALNLARECDDGWKIGHSLNRLGNCLANTGDFATSLTLHREALLVLEQLGDADGITDTLDLLGSTNFISGTYRDSAEFYDRAIARSRGLGDRMRLSSTLSNQALQGGDYDISFDAGVAVTRSPETWVRYAEEGVEIAREIGWTAGESFALAVLGSVVSVRGEPGRGLVLLDEAARIARRIDHQQWLTATSLILGSLWNDRLDQSLAELHLERGRALARGTGSHLWMVLTDCALAAIRAERGDLESAWSLLAPWTDGDPDSRSHADRAMRFAEGQVRLAAGDPAGALERASRLLELDERSPEIAGIPQVLRLRADALHALKRFDEAESAFDWALDASIKLGYRSVEWRVLLGLSDVLTERGEASRAEEYRTRAASIVVEIAQTIVDPETRDRFNERASDLLRRRVRTAMSMRNPGGLSSRQIEVLSLVARGMTDAQVAEQLFISPRTVARHLQAIYNKLGVSSRTAAVTHAYEHHLIEPVT